MLLKVCGMRERDNIKDVLALQPQWMGFIFEPSSPRYFPRAANPSSLFEVIGAVKKVGVFVNDDEEVMLSFQQQHALDYIQLHGDESVETCRQLKQAGIKVIKAFRVNDMFDFSIVDSYTPYADLFLFDASGTLFGGNGVAFNWQLLKRHRFNKPFLLSGGIGPDSVNQLLAFEHPEMIGVDVNSKFETAPGIKDAKALLLFQQQIG